MAARCPVCGAENGECTDMKQSVFMEEEMPKGREDPKFRMPQQFVREGRGVPGYTGDVETYDPRGEEKPKNVKTISGTKSRSPKEDK